MTDREILEKYITLHNSCLSKEEKVKVMNMLFDYREAFSLRDEIGTSCRSLVFSGTVHWFVGRQAFIHYCGLHQV